MSFLPSTKSEMSGHGPSAANRLDDYIKYHLAMSSIGDTDPGYPAMLYLADRFEFNTEQRYWLAFLYAATYCVTTAWYIWNEFPDLENVDLGRMERWWTANRDKVVFQTDRRWTRSRNLFVDQVQSYREVIGSRDQEEKFITFLADTPEQTYHNAYEEMMKVRQFGRFSMFLYLEAVQALTDFPFEPQGLDLRNSESSRNGLCYALGLDNLLTGHDYGRETLERGEITRLDGEFERLASRIKAIDQGSTVWSIETTLCAYKKVHRGGRYLGYYIDRQYDDIAKMQANVKEGVDWSVMWEFRRAHFDAPWLRECREKASGDPRRLRPGDPAHWYTRPVKWA